MSETMLSLESWCTCQEFFLECPGYKCLFVEIYILHYLALWLNMFTFLAVEHQMPWLGSILCYIFPSPLFFDLLLIRIKQTNWINKGYEVNKENTWVKATNIKWMAKSVINAIWIKINDHAKTRFLQNQPIKSSLMVFN